VVDDDGDLLAAANSLEGLDERRAVEDGISGGLRSADRRHRGRLVDDRHLDGVGPERLVAVGLMIGGVALFGVVTATLAAWFVGITDAAKPESDPPA